MKQLLHTRYTKQKQILDQLHKKNPTKSSWFNQIYQVAPQQVKMKDLGDMDLFSLWTDHPKLLSKDLDHVIREILDALTTMWKTGVVHRDIKPENIMAQYDPATKHIRISLVDFTDSLKRDDLLTQPSFTFPGTLAFASPELLHRMRTDPRDTRPGTWDEYMANDLWALGMLLYGLIYDKYLFEKFRDFIRNNKKYQTIPELYQLYEQLRVWPSIYHNLFPTEHLPKNKKKYVPLVQRLLSFDPTVRLQWWKDRVAGKQKVLSSGTYSTVSRGTAGTLIKRSRDASSNIEKYQHQKRILDRLRQKNPSISHLFAQIFQVNPKGQSIMKDLGDTTLYHAIRHDFPTLSRHINHVIRQLIEAVMAMLKSEVVHRDIKPDNIMVFYDGLNYHITFVDFTDAMTKNQVNSSTRYWNFGSPDYMSPEALQRRHKKDTKKGRWEEYVANDLWSLGMVIYNLLYQEHPLDKLRRFKPHLAPARRTFSNMASTYNTLKKRTAVYEQLFPKTNNPYYQDVKDLLSMDPEVRLRWYQKKIQTTQTQRLRQQKALQAVSQLLQASQLLSQPRPSKRIRTSLD